MNAADSWVARAAGWTGGLADSVARPRLSIAIFHRVMPRPDPLFPEEMHAERFDRLLTMLKQAFCIVTLGQALALQAAGRLPRRALAITFDDGYADNAEVALPILQRQGLKATFFVATGFLDGGRMFNDTVIECLRETRVDDIDLAEWGLGPCKLDAEAPRRRAIDALLPKVKYMSLLEREQFLRRLLSLAGDPTLPADLMMRSGQVVELHRAGMEIGGHTVNHPILRVLPDAEAEVEIATGRDRLQSLIGAPVEVFAYPNGKPGQDYDSRHVEMVRRLGFKAAVSTSPGVATFGPHVHELPRFSPWDRQPSRWVARLLQQRLLGTEPRFAEA